MSLLHVHFFSRALIKNTALAVLMPDQGNPPFPTLYLLHGLSDDHTIWIRRTSLERYVQELPLTVVMPAADRSFYVNNPHVEGAAYADFIAEDVVDYCERIFPLRRERSARALAGFSMGGYGAIMLALRHSDRFGAAASHAGALGFGHRPYRPELQAIADAAGPGYDCFELAGRAAANPDLSPPRLRLDCGLEDFLLADNQAFHRHLETIGYAHEYRENPGGHTWEYCDRHIQDTIRFLVNFFSGPR